MLCTIKTTAESGAVAELADAGDLKSPGANHVGSIPTRPTLVIWGNSPLKSPYFQRKACGSAGFFFYTGVCV